MSKPFAHATASYGRSGFFPFRNRGYWNYDFMGKQGRIPRDIGRGGAVIAVRGNYEYILDFETGEIKQRKKK